MDLKDLQDQYFLDISPTTLAEWHELNEDFEQSLRTLLVTPRVSNYQIPACYRRDPSNAKNSIPYPAEIIFVVNLLDRCRFRQNLSIREARDLVVNKGLSVSTPQSIVNMFDRFEESLGLLPALAKTIRPKDTRHKLELQRKKRETTKLLKQQQQDKLDKKELEKRLAQTQVRVVKKAKDTKMTREELEYSGKGLDQNIKTLKEQAKESRFELKQEVDPSRIIFTPTPRQAEFLSASEKVVFYGGAAGGGKSYALVMDAIRYAHRPAMRALILRRRNSELKELISVTKQIYPKAFPGAKFNETNTIWTFPSGATLEFGYMDKPDDKERYIGLPYSYIGWDEIQLQRSPEGFDFLFSRLRTTDPEITCYIRCTGNPGGAPWVKQRFIDPAPYNTPFLRHQADDKENGISFRFIPATLFDNPYLAENGEYEKILRQMPPKKVQQLLFGNWDVVEDGFFQWDSSIHETDEMPPMHWPIISAMDYGWNDPASTLWAKINPLNGAIHVYRELEVIQNTVEQWADKMAELEASEHYVRVQDRIIDHTLFNATGHTGPSHLETLGKRGFRPRPADRQREPGWEQVNNRLRPSPLDNTPSLYIHSDCKRLIDQLKTAMPKETNPNDIEQRRMFSMGRRHHWDLLDTLRYICMARPRTIVSDLLLSSVKAEKTWNKYNTYFS